MEPREWTRTRGGRLLVSGVISAVGVALGFWLGVFAVLFPGYLVVAFLRQEAHDFPVWPILGVNWVIYGFVVFTFLERKASARDLKG